MPDRMSNRMSEDMSDRMPEDLPVRKCINVMVGITRSKVIWGFSGVNVPNNTNPTTEEISAEIPKFWKIPAQHLRIKHGLVRLSSRNDVLQLIFWLLITCGIH